MKVWLIDKGTKGGRLQRVDDVNKVSKDDNPANIMTKTVLNNKFRHFLDLIGMCSTQ